MTSPDQFQVTREVPFAELEEQLHGITLLNQPDVHPYENAKISIERFTWEDVLPTSRYIVSRQLAVQRAIRSSIVPFDYDQLELEGGLIIVGGEKGQQGLIPPLVEEFDEGMRIPYLLDGIHRVRQGQIDGRSGFLGLFVRGIRPDCPPYAFPNDWSEIKEQAEKPEDKSTWKNYRGDANKGEQYALYRDYSPINGSTPRGS